MALMLSHWSKISHAIFNLREHSKTTCHWMETAECFGMNGLTYCFVWPVVLFKDVLGTILAAVCEHHYHLIAVCSRIAGLL